ncbi:MAG TPA: hypothetical protein ENK99_06265, partial [Campylobacterales bacterium]|nr:hypothetical protein [Campylobacterales bacterium]
MTTLKKLLLATVLSTATLLAGFSTVDCTNQAHLDILKLPQVECEALEALWDATDGPNWTDTTNWDTLTYADTWSGVYMHDDNSSIKWFGWGGKGNNLVGQLPEEIGNFENIEILLFTRDALTGEVPLSINNLHSLKALQLTETQLSGPLPKLSLFSNLYFINFIGNHFTGSI